MNCQVKIILDEYAGTGNMWGVDVNAVVTVRKPRTLLDTTPEKWASLVGIAVGETIGKELEGKVR